MDQAQKKLAVNLSFGIGIALIVVGILLMMFGGFGFGMVLFVLGMIGAILGLIYALIPARATAPRQASPSAASTLQQLGELHRAGTISDAEFEAKKTELLGRI